VGAVRLLGIACGLVINRADMGDQQVSAYARREDIPVLLEIPYDRRIAEAYSQGATIIETLPPWEEKFINLFEQIETRVA
jgi:MinD superfamily P-loop ATPase